jgi:hypothetical protein
MRIDLYVSVATCDFGYATTYNGQLSVCTDVDGTPCSALRHTLTHAHSRHFVCLRARVRRVRRVQRWLCA